MSSTEDAVRRIGTCPGYLVTLVLAVASFSSPTSAEETVIVDARKRLQTFEGWGTSLCWWADRVGDWPDDKLDPLLKLVTDSEEGLGYTIFRYNIGGGDAPGHAHMRAGAAVPGYRPTENGPYDWSADARQRRVLNKLLAQTDGAILEAFALSAPYWMTRSGCSAGAADGSSNLEDEYYDDFADYLTEVVKHFRDEWGIKFRTLEPMNEPNADWWKAETPQEGCHYGVAEQERLIQEIAKHMRRKGLTGTAVSAPDTNSLDTCVDNLKVYGPATIEALGQINAHSYYGERRRELRDLARRHQKRFWQSESGPLFFKGDALATQLFMAERIVRDIRDMQVVAWVDWQFMAGLNWGCTDWLKKPHTFRINKKLYVYAQFTRFIRPGDKVLALDTPHLLAAVSEKHHRLVLVVVNSGDAARSYRVEVKGLVGHRHDAGAYRTSEDEDCVRLPTLVFEGDTLRLEAKPRSVTTLSVFEEKPE